MAILATCVRNEGLYLLEWFAFYSILGFKRIVVYSNNNDDLSDELLSCLHDYGYIIWRPRVLAANESPQLTAFADLSRELLELKDSNLLRGLTEQERYLAWLDCDEFLHIKCSTIQNIPQLLNAYDFPDGLSLNWRHYGSSSQNTYTQGLTIERFLYASSPDFIHDKQIKTISKISSDHYSEITHHRPFKKPGSCANIIYTSNPNHEERSVPSSIIDRGELAVCLPEAEIHHEVCQLNHYSIRSLQEYTIKTARGNGYQSQDHNSPHFHDDYFQTRDVNDILDDGLSRNMSDKVHAFIGSLESPIANSHASVVDFYMTRRFPNLRIK
jgi:hypothetical protein